MSDGADDTVAAGREAWLRIRENGRRHWDDWLAVGRALSVGRSLALAEAATEKPYGPTYTKAMTRWLRQNGFAGLDDTERARAVWMIRNLPEITAWRDSLTEAQRRNVNHPSTCLRGYRRSTAKRPHVVAKAAAPAEPVVPSVTAPAAETARSFHSKPRAIHWPESAMRRAFDAMRLSKSNDLMVLTRLCLEAAVRTESELLELLPANQPKTQVRSVMPKPKAKRQTAPADAVVLQ